MGLYTANLDAYSRLALPIILARYPDWQAAATIHRDHGYVEFTLPCPSPAVELGLWVLTEGEELTVAFHTDHTHFTDYDDRTHIMQIEAGLQYAADILEERVGVLSWYRRREFAGSTSVELPYAGSLAELWARTTDEWRKLYHGRLDLAGLDRVTLRSWRGTFDAEETYGASV